MAQLREDLQPRGSRGTRQRMARGSGSEGEPRKT